MKVTSHIYRMGAALLDSERLHEGELIDISFEVTKMGHLRPGDIVMLVDCDDSRIVGVMLRSWTDEASRMMEPPPYDPTTSIGKLGSEVSLFMLMAHPTLGNDTIH